MASDASHDAVFTRRLAGAPISWGVCEVPGWGAQLGAERVLSEMASLGLTATELGPVGYLPLQADALRAVLDRHGLALVGGFVPLVLHEPEFTAMRAEADRIAAVYAAAGADVFVLAAVADADWGPRLALGDEQWARLAARVDELDELVAGHGLTLAIHPHVGTLIETRADVERLLAATTAGWCFDTGHLLIGGVDPAAFAREHADRIVHVHLKDVDAAVAARLNAGELSLLEAVRSGLFRALGEGDAGIEAALRHLDESGYERWLVLEQDTALAGTEPPAGRGPIDDVRKSVAFLSTRAPRERVQS